MRPPSSWTWGVPRTLVIPVGLPERSFVAKLPRLAMTVGWISAICFHRYGWHASISFGIGSRLPGGRDLRTLAMKTSSRERPISPRSSDRS